MRWGFLHHSIDYGPIGENTYLSFSSPSPVVSLPPFAARTQVQVARYTIDMTSATARVLSRTAPKPASQAAAKVLIADKFETSGVEGLKQLGCEVEVKADLTPETLPQALADCGANILIVRSTKVPAAVFEKVSKLSLG